MEPLRVGVVGCGAISAAYLRNLAVLASVETVACADLLPARARQRADEFSVPRACGVDDLLAAPDVDLVLNLTVPASHADVALAALGAGKHAYNEKPLAVERDDGRRLVQAARAAGLLLGGAPDTFLGGGLQTCRKLIDEGAIGEPVAATAFMLGRGHERWHPDPGFFYRRGGGPMFDMGPYYLTALVSLLGPVRRVTGSTRASFAERVIGSEPLRGQVIDVQVPTHVAGVLDFDAGPVATIVTSFDVWAAQVPRIEIYGSEGSLAVPDPNTFRGPVRLRLGPSGEWQEAPITHGWVDNSRGIGVADLAQAAAEGRSPRAGAELTYHVLDLMHAVHDASDQGRHVMIDSTCERPAPLPPDWSG